MVKRATILNSLFKNSYLNVTILFFIHISYQKYFSTHDIIQHIINYNSANDRNNGAFGQNNLAKILNNFTFANYNSTVY